MSEKTKKPVDENLDEVSRSHSSDGERPLLPTLVHVGSGLAHTAMDASFVFARECSVELFQRATSAVEFVDETQQATLRLVRRALVHADRVSIAAIDAGERVARGAVRTTTVAGEAVTELAARATIAVAGKEATRRAPPAASMPAAE